jgi:hypothetical protein
MAHILRSNEVTLDAPYQLDISLVQGHQDSSCQVIDSEQVRIVESTPQYTLIEVACPCGQKTTLRCEHGGH